MYADGFLTKVVRMRIFKRVVRMRTVQHCFRYVRVKAGVSENSRADKKPEKNPRAQLGEAEKLFSTLVVRS